MEDWQFIKSWQAITVTSSVNRRFFVSEVITDETMLCVIFERAKEVEKAAFETRRNLERSWGMEWIDYHNAETIAAERLTA